MRLAARRFGFRNKLNVHPAEIGIFGRWIACQCGSRADSVRHFAKRLVGIAGQSALPDLIAMIEATQSATGHGMGEDETDAIANKPGHQK